jgi:hypothetical protein
MSLIGKTITYSINKETSTEGVVLDKLIMREKQEDNFSITGYLVENTSTSKIEPIANWRVKKIH